MIESESVAIQCTLRREGESGRKESEKSKRRVLLATDHTASYAKIVRYSERKQQMNVISRHEVESSGGSRNPMVKETRGKPKREERRV